MSRDEAGTAAATHPVSPASLTEDAIMVLFGVCLMGGALADGWAHNNISKIETFFTPWHALLYAGFSGCAAWTYRLAYRRRAQAPRWWRDGWPAGYGLGALGVLIFGAGGAGDAAWHQIFGVETSIDALLSPTHLLLELGSVLLLTSPLRSWWAVGAAGPRAAGMRTAGPRAAPGVAALALGTTSVSVFLIYASAFHWLEPIAPYQGAQGTPGYTAAARGLSSYVITTALLVVPLLLVYRRRATPGLATALVGSVALFAVGTFNFQATQVLAALATTGAAVLVDWLLFRLDAGRGDQAPLRLPIAGALFPAVIWSAQLLALHLSAGIRWPVELWTGTVVSTALLGALLGGLAARPELPAAG